MLWNLLSSMLLWMKKDALEGAQHRSTINNDITLNAAAKKPSMDVVFLLNLLLRFTPLLNGFVDNVVSVCLVCPGQPTISAATRYKDLRRSETPKFSADLDTVREA
eukprot:g69827.t1